MVGSLAEAKGTHAGKSNGSLSLRTVCEGISLIDRRRRLGLESPHLGQLRHMRRAAL